MYRLIYTLKRKKRNGADTESKLFTNIEAAEIEANYALQFGKAKRAVLVKDGKVIFDMTT